MTVAHKLPASRETVENNAVAKASPNPNSASRNFTHTSAAVDCSHCASRPGLERVDGLTFIELATVEPTASQPSILPWNGQSRSPCTKSLRNRHLPSREATQECSPPRKRWVKESGTQSSRRAAKDPDFVVLTCQVCHFWFRFSCANLLAS